MKKIFVAIAVIIAIVCFNSCEENYFELPTTHGALNEAVSGANGATMVDSIKSQREWLIEFYNVYNGDEWTNNENWCSPYPLNTWHGIETDSNGYVTAIRLTNNNLTSEIDTKYNFKAFPNLHTLDLSNNSLIIDLYCRLPPFIEYLDISKNKVPSIEFNFWVMTSLKYLNISNNDTIIDLFIANAPYLEELKIDNIKYNNFTLIGDACPKLKLKHLDISHNNGDGSGRVFISGWDSLQTLDISNVTISNVSIHSTKNLRKIKCNNFEGSMKFYNAWMEIISYGSSKTHHPYANNIDSIDIRNSTLSFSIEKPLNLVYLDAHNTTFTSPCHLEAPLLETLNLCNSNEAEIHIETAQNTCRLKNIYCENAVGHHLVFESYLNRLNINEHFNNIKITCKYSIDTLNISNYNGNTLLINDCNYLDVYNSKIGFPDKWNMVNKKANFVNSVCDNLIYNNFANGCYLNFENTILNQINGNADAEPVNANCSFYQSYTEWYNHFPK